MNPLDLKELFVTALANIKTGSKNEKKVIQLGRRSTRFWKTTAAGPSRQGAGSEHFERLNNFW